MVKLAIFSVFALCVFKSISCERVEFGDCGNQMSTLKEVDITPCPQATEKRPCQLKRGTEETIEVKFTPSRRYSPVGDARPGQKYGLLLDCDGPCSKESKVEEVDITPCPAQPCQLKRGTNVTAEVKFITSTETISKATTVIYGIIGGVKIPFAGVSKDACQDQGLTCPLKPETENTFKTALPVKPLYPPVSALS
ncbi:unnamed protein product [Porites evermanni]|uniref:MD-2-related lipid-recognition domain-containing protein n=1 Tax=Porites evermanni TaxID=104178 RepID=A0ABN8N211_9CNID|nr:unnamed protein product [Porites evermanni]